LREAAKEELDEASKASLKAMSEKNIEECYRIVIGASQASSLASYISDDVELILECLALGVKNDFLCSLIHAYAKGKIPGNGMETVSNLPERINWL
jgi:hypothetical protein